MDIPHFTDRVDGVSTRWGPTVLRWTAALLWLSNVNWKVPPDFGRSGDQCVALCRYVEAGAEFPVGPGSALFFDNVASPNLALFGWVTLITESVLVVLLVSGRFLRSSAALGMAMSAGIGLAVANAEHEWYWSYLLMIARHLVILVTAPTARKQTARAMGAITALYGVLVAVTHAGAGFSGSGDWHLFSQDNDLPGEWGRGTFPGSIALGLGFVILGAAAWFVTDRLDQRSRRVVGWVLVGVGASLLLTYERGGLVIGLGSRPGNACMLAALGLALAVPAGASGGHHGPGPAGAPD
ncbi:hypothetical protein BH18ACT4_BH18ACT4_03710 [soil metagenome]